MSYAQARRFQPTFPTQDLRGFPVRELRGLGAIELTPEQAEVLIKGLSAQIKASLDDLVKKAQTETAKIVKTYKGSFARFARFIQDELLPGQTIGKTPADEWAFNIVGYAENVRTILSRTDDSGKPFFVRLPNDAKRILEGAQKDLVGMINELGDQVKSMSFSNSVMQITTTAIGALVGLADILIKAGLDAAVKFPLGSIALASVAGIVIWFKFFR